MSPQETETWSVLSGTSAIHETNMKHPFSEQDLLKSANGTFCEILNALKQSCTQSYNNILF